MQTKPPYFLHGKNLFKLSFMWELGISRRKMNISIRFVFVNITAHKPFLGSQERSLPSKGVCQTITRTHKIEYLGSCCLVRGNSSSIFYFKIRNFWVPRLSWAVDCPGSKYSAGPAGVDHFIILKR